MDTQVFHEALDSIWSVIRAANIYIDAQAPWKLRKENPDRMRTVLYVLAECIRRLAILTQPFMPDASSKLLDQLGISISERTIDAMMDNNRRLQPGSILPQPEGVFPRFIEEEVSKREET